jgi:muramoyltetrapeptide carboxypeptidase
VSLRRPRALIRGGRIGIVSPSSPFSRDEFDRGVAEIRRLGYVPVYDDSVFAKEDGYLSGSPATRASAFMRYWTDPGVGALIAVRGGYGSAQILPLLDCTAMAATPKVFIGYSDNTSILAWLTTQCGITALHGPMLDGRLAKGTSAYDRRSFVALLGGGARLELAPDAVETLQAGDATGPLFGGTMTQLVASLGTPYAFDPPDGCVLFIEDVNERPYRIDRMLTQLTFAGILGRARALVFGQMRGCDEPGGQLTARDVVRRLTRDFPGPVTFGFPSGHTEGPCWTLPLGVRVRVMTAPQPAIVVEEPAVE